MAFVMMGIAAALVIIVGGALILGSSRGGGNKNSPEDISSVAMVEPTEIPVQTGSQPPSCTDAGLAWQSPQDGMTLVCVPKGDFRMGSNDGEPVEQPVHQVYLDAFWVDLTEITNVLFERFVQETGYQTDAEKAGKSYNWRKPSEAVSSLSGLEGHPVVRVSWNDAEAYCTWAGRRLLTEAEWEKAARGTDERNYPWGNQPPNPRLLNFDGIADKFERTAPVASYLAGTSPYGAVDMSGNVWEWVADWYADGYPVSDLAINPVGPTAGENRVVRGGSWFNSQSSVRSTKRSFLNPLDQDDQTGFRCAYPPLP